MSPNKHGNPLTIFNESTWPELPGTRPLHTFISQPSWAPGGGREGKYRHLNPMFIGTYCIIIVLAYTVLIVRRAIKPRDFRIKYMYMYNVQQVPHICTCIMYSKSHINIESTSALYYVQCTLYTLNKSALKRSQIILNKFGTN